jgi:membrane-bound ClpP family serine protease
MDYWALAIILLVVSFGLAILEVFFPSGGVFGFLSVAAMVGAAIFGFQSGTYVGAGILIAGLLGLPTIVAVALLYLPETRMGRKLMLSAPTSEDVLPRGNRELLLKKLIGRQGVAKTIMLPAGAVTIENRTIDAVSEGMVIEAGQPVRVIDVRGNRVVVQPLENGQASEKPDDEDPLSKSYDSFGLEPFEE